MGYYGWSNMGDAIQTIALARLLPGDPVTRFRDELKHKGVSIDREWVINGFFHTDYQERYKSSDAVFIPNFDCRDVLYAGIHLDDCGDFFRGCSRPIGSRDSYTHRILEMAGVRSEISGCATITLPRYNGKRHGELRIEDGEPGCKSQEIPYRTSWKQQCEWAVKRMTQMMTAECVTTSRLHVALPCLAFGTPVKVPWKAFSWIHNPSRMTALDDLGFEYDKFNVIDITEAADRYKNFLTSQLALDSLEDKDWRCIPYPTPV